MGELCGGSGICVVTIRWLADNLTMGKTSSVQSWVSNKREDKGVKVWLQKLQNHGILDRCFSAS